MTGLLRIDRDGLPWQPTPDTKRVATWHYYDMPLEGVIVQDGQRYVFVCLEFGSLWEYVPITAEDQDLLEYHIGPRGQGFGEQFDAWLEAQTPVRIVEFRDGQLAEKGDPHAE